MNGAAGGLASDGPREEQPPSPELAVDVRPTGCLDPDAPQGDLLDVRSPRDFLAGHDPAAANIPLEELSRSIHELPSPGRPLRIFDESQVRMRWARSRLRARGYLQVALADAAPKAEWIVGRASVRLWQPTPWVAHMLPVVLADLRAHAGVSEVSRPQTAVDLACGTGRDAVYMSMHGLRTIGLDLLPDALDRARRLAARHGAALETAVMDVEAAEVALPQNLDLIVCCRFLHRPLFEAIRGAVRPGGWVIYETFVEPQRQVHGRPRREALVLKTGELQSQFDGWTIAESREGPVASGAILASIAARRPV